MPNQETKSNQEDVEEPRNEGLDETTCPACGCKDTEDPGWECPREKCPIRKRNAWHQHAADEAKLKSETAMAAAIGAGYCGHLRLLNAGSDAARILGVCLHDAGHNLNGVGMWLCNTCRADITPVSEDADWGHPLAPTYYRKENGKAHTPDTNGF